MNENLKIIRGLLIMFFGYFLVIFIVDNFFFKVIDSTTITIGFVLPAVFAGAVIGEKIRKGKK